MKQEVEGGYFWTDSQFPNQADTPRKLVAISLYQNSFDYFWLILGILE